MHLYLCDCINWTAIVQLVFKFVGEKTFILHIYIAQQLTNLIT